MNITYSVAKLFDLFMLILVVRILLTWFPNINWRNQPFKGLKVVSDVFLEPFRKVIPPVGMLDLSPIVAFICLDIIKILVIYFLKSIGL